MKRPFSLSSNSCNEVSETVKHEPTASPIVNKVATIKTEVRNEELVVHKAKKKRDSDDVMHSTKLVLLRNITKDRQTMSEHEKLPQS